MNQEKQSQLEFNDLTKGDEQRRNLPTLDNRANESFGLSPHQLEGGLLLGLWKFLQSISYDRKLEIPSRPLTQCASPIGGSRPRQAQALPG